MLSRSITTSLPCSTSLCALAKTISATFTWLLGSSSNVEYITSPLIDLFISVTSSGRSSTSKTINSISGLFLSILFATFFNNVVFPAFGGATISPLWPLPIGATRSINLMESSLEPISREILSLGKIGVKESKSGLLIATPGSSPLTSFT